MRENPVKRTIASGAVSFGTMAFEFNSPGLARLAAGAGAEFCVFDQEHTGWSVEIIKTLVAPSVRSRVAEVRIRPRFKTHVIAGTHDARSRHRVNVIDALFDGSAPRAAQTRATWDAPGSGGGWRCF